MKVRKKLNIAQCVEENYEGGIAVEEIKVGEYVRTENGLIGKVNKIEPAGSGCRYAGEFLTDEIIQFNDGKIYERRVRRKQAVKHSKEVIDLIECGDYVNGREVKHIAMFEGFPDYQKLIFVDEKHLIPDDTCENDEIKTILTKEQFEQNCYKIQEGRYVKNKRKNACINS